MTDHDALVKELQELVSRWVDLSERWAVHAARAIATLEQQAAEIARLRALLTEAVEAEFAAFKAEVSEAVTDALKGCGLDALKQAYIAHRFSRFIIDKPDPLVDVCDALGLGRSKTAATDLRAALARHNLEIAEKAHD